MRINHVTILVEDKERSKSFYVDGLGLDYKIINNKHLWILVGEEYLHITDSMGRPAYGSLAHFAIEVEDLNSYAGRLIEKGLRIFALGDQNQEELITSVSENIQHFFVRDPDGNLLEFVDSKSQFFHQ